MWAGLDLETAGIEREFALQPWRVANNTGRITSVVCLGIEGHEVSTEVRADMVPAIRRFLRAAAEKKVPVVGWNVAFDIAWLIAKGLRDEVFKVSWLDGMLLLKHLRQHPTFEMALPDIKAMSFGLKAAVAEFLPEEAGYEEGIDFQSDDPEMRLKRLVYNVKDVKFSIQISEMLWEKLTPAQRRVAKIEAASLPLVADAWVRGININLNKAYELKHKLEDTANEQFVRLKLTDAEVTREMLSSPVKLNKKLRAWGLPIIKVTETGNASTDRDSLGQLALMDPRAKMVAEYREANNNLAKFVVAPLTSCIYNKQKNVTHPQPRVYGTYTGRMTYTSTQGTGKQQRHTGIALHQWKRDPEFRALVDVPEGYDLLEFDFAGQEFRWMAVVSNDPTMVNLCQPGEDAHSYMGASIRGLDYRELIERVHSGDKDAKSARQLGKVANLSLQYRTSANRLQQMARVQYGLSIGPTDAMGIHTTYQRTYRRVPDYWRRQQALARQKTHISNMLGRRIHFVAPGERLGDMSWSYEATAINFPIQSMGAEQRYLALMVAKTYLPKFNAYFYFDLHDAMVFIVPKQNTRRMYDTMLKVFSNLPYKRAWGLEFPVHFPVDGKFGPNWGEMHEPKD